jgi:uncharacterized membrane protein (DUF106 family)
MAMDVESEKLLRVLEEIRDNQRAQIASQHEALALQREQFELVRRQAERTERIQERSERIQDRSSQIVTSARRLFFIVVPALIALVLYVSWMMFVR